MRKLVEAAGWLRCGRPWNTGRVNTAPPGGTTGTLAEDPLAALVPRLRRPPRGADPGACGRRALPPASDSEGGHAPLSQSIGTADNGAAGLSLQPRGPASCKSRTALVSQVVPPGSRPLRRQTVHHDTVVTVVYRPDSRSPGRLGEKPRPGETGSRRLWRV